MFFLLSLQCLVAFHTNDHLVFLNRVWLLAVILSLSSGWLGWVTPGSVFGPILFILITAVWALPCSSVLNLQIKLLIPTACGPSLPLNVDVRRQTVTSHPGPAPDLQCPQNGDISPWPNKGCRQLGPCKTHGRDWVSVQS